MVQFESIAGFGAIIDRLGQFTEVLEPFGTSPMTKRADPATDAESSPPPAEASKISLEDLEPSTSSPLLELHSVTLRPPDGSSALVENLSLKVPLLSLITANARFQPFSLLQGRVQPIGRVMHCKIVYRIASAARIGCSRNLCMNAILLSMHASAKRTILNHTMSKLEAEHERVLQMV